MNRIAFLFGIVMCVVSISSTDVSAWTDADYARHGVESFEKFAPANRRIDPNRVDYSLLHAAIFFETNRQRIAHGRRAFRHSAVLEAAAFGHSRDMVTHEFTSHTSVVHGKETLEQRLQISGVRNIRIGENIAVSSALEYKAGTPVYTPDQNNGYFSYTPNGTPIEPRTYIDAARTVVAQWMQSPGHRRNILNPGFNYLGTGAAIFRNSAFYEMPYFKATQVFANRSDP